ncbi:hypothetical protein [Amycolatopsis sp. NBC_01480]|uniref:hypothetical protein n=1 Tax=Amycolatopsis sp. NBC_01480 TaxID=2903562 RepID=UPI002E2ACD14|nr:hypothetical protein [Amycolatopsis sp. NBC_01480]
MAHKFRVAVIVVVFAAGSTVNAGAVGAQPSSTSVTAAGITAAVHQDGTYEVRAQQPAAWTFTGSVGAKVTDNRTRTGQDSIGSYREIDFGYTDTVSRTASIRVYQNTPAVLFGSTTGAASPNVPASGVPFPSLKAPVLPHQESFQDRAFSTYKFGGTPAPDSPLLSFDDQANGFLFSAADNFPVAKLAVGAGNTLSEGIAASVTTLPAGFTHQSMLALGKGIGSTYGTWGSALMALGGKHRVPNDANDTLDKLGYWTDNGAEYYYKYDESLGYTGTLLAAAKDFADHGIPLGYLQLDSWWYPKGSSNTWQGNGNLRGGEYTYRAAPDLFQQGLAAFRDQVGLPLITHARWIDPASPYHGQYTMSGNVVTDPRFWEGTMRYLADSGVVGYEQDWLSDGAQAQYNLTDPNAFVDNMAHSAAAKGIDLQYCMPLPWNYLQSTKYQNLQTTRVSNDRFERGKWDEYLFDSHLAGSLGEQPWSDVFMSKETDNLLLSLLSGGMVGVGDKIGDLSTTNLNQTVRGDGVLVKPDSPIVPLDSTYLAIAKDAQAPMVAATHSDHNGLRDAYVFAYARNGGSQSIGFSPAELGVNGAAYVYDYFSGKGQLVPAGGRFTGTVSDGSYYVVSPVGQSGIAFLGDAGKFVSAGSKRISRLSDQGKVQAAVQFGTGERSVQLHGYAPAAPKVTVTSGTAGPVSYDAATHLFTVAVTPGPGQKAQVQLSR